MTVSTGVKSLHVVAYQGTRQKAVQILISILLCLCIYCKSTTVFFQTVGYETSTVLPRDPYLTAKNVYFALDVSGPTGLTIDPHSPLIH